MNVALWCYKWTDGWIVSPIGVRYKALLYTFGGISGQMELGWVMWWSKEQVTVLKKSRKWPVHLSQFSIHLKEGSMKSPVQSLLDTLISLPLHLPSATTNTFFSLLINRLEEVPTMAAPSSNKKAADAWRGRACHIISGALLSIPFKDLQTWISHFWIFPTTSLTFSWAQLAS